jgi:hypothetical protein
MLSGCGTLQLEWGYRRGRVGGLHVLLLGLGLLWCLCALTLLWCSGVLRNLVLFSSSSSRIWQ